MHPRECRLAQALAQWGGEEQLGRDAVEVRAPAGGWTLEAVATALDRLRRRIIYGLFGTTEEEVRCPPEELLGLRVRRLVRLSRRYGETESVYAAIRNDAELRDAVMAELAKKDQDLGEWSDLMDRLNPGWRLQFTST